MNDPVKGTGKGKVKDNQGKGKGQNKGNPSADPICTLRYTIHDTHACNSFLSTNQADDRPIIDSGSVVSICSNSFASNIQNGAH